MFAKAFLFAYAAAALVSISQSLPPQTSLLVSPCPELFRYEEVDKQGYWTGNLVLRPDYDLSGVWIRLIFDKEVKDLTVDHEFVIKHEAENKKLVKLQNKDLTAKADIAKILKIKVSYEGSEIPSLIEYRLNARTLCPQANIGRSDIFQGDVKSSYFLPSLHNQPEVYPTDYQCGAPQVSNLYPWQASLYLHLHKEETYVCEAILISPSHLVTAAHCVTFKNDSHVIPRAFVRLNLGSEPVSANVEKKYVRDIVVHPGYRVNSLLDDIAILRLAHPVEVGKTFVPICLGATEDKPGNREFVTGFKLEEDGNPGKLLESNVVRISRDECNKMSPHLKNALTYDNFCVKYKSDEKICVGDSGSGLMSINGRKVTLRGIVSLGVKLQNLKSCDAKTNVVITDIHRYISWINHSMYYNDFL